MSQDYGNRWVYRIMAGVFILTVLSGYLLVFGLIWVVAKVVTLWLA